MALSERSRSELFRTLGPLVGQEVVGEMLSHFPARDVDEPVSKDFFRADMAIQRADLVGQMSDLRGEMNSQMSDLRGEMNSQMSDLRGEMNSQMSDLRGELNELRIDLGAQMADLRGELRGLRILGYLNVTVLISFAALITTMIKF